ncbi:DUF2474 domain-containing protein [Agrobacterium tumefaciens]|uniref:DUF2474 domain-containing protein n=1 Tax=Agrobacterium tumefaciens TaxID=358 RepID=UPI00384C6F48
MGLLRFPREGEGWGGIPLTEKVSGAPSLWSRLGWLVAIWSASVCALGVAALAFRWLMSLAGMTP